MSVHDLNSRHVSETRQSPTSAKYDRPAAACDAPEACSEDDSSALDETAFDDLADRIGAEKVEGLVRRFAKDLANRFAQPGNRESLRKDAHAIRSSAEAMGFRQLSGAAKRLEETCRGEGDLTTCVADLLHARREASRILARRFA